MRYLRLFLMAIGVRPPLVGDDFSKASAWCRHCGGDVVVIRPGDYRCARCEN